METPEKVLEFLGTISCINEGGCGIAALSFYRWVEKNCPALLDGVSIVYLYYNEEYRKFEKNMQVIFSGNYQEIWTPPHIGIFWDDCILEAGGGEVQEYKLWHEVSVKVLEANLRNFWAWNGTFSRFLNFPVIENSLGISLEDIPIAGHTRITH